LETTTVIQQEEDNRTNLLCAFFGKNSDYYITKYLELKNNRYCFNYSAFLAGIFWLGYRKLYKELFIVFCSFIIIDIIQMILKLDINLPIGIAVSIVFGKFGNYLYITKATKAIQTIKSPMTLDTSEINRITKYGGTSIKGLFLSIFLFVIYVMLCLFVYP